MSQRILFATDRPSYTGIDAGCHYATEYLTELNGEPTQSSCTECPSESCCIFELIDRTAPSKGHRHGPDFVTKYFTGQLD